MQAEVSPELLERLERIDGVELTRGEPLARYNTFRIGGPAEVLVRVGSLPALERLVAAVRGGGLPLQVLGLGSNVLVPDEGLAGVVVRLAGELAEVRYEEERVRAGAAVTLGELARRTAGQGLLGLESLAGFPSSVGGAVVMNAGCYGTEIADVLVSATVVDGTGRSTTVGVDELGAGYRTTRLQGSNLVVADALFRLRPGDAVAALARIREIQHRRRASLPYGHPNAGSVFRNPPGDYAGRLIDECGLKGRRSGGAQISPKHGNVIVNLGGASADDVLDLMRRARGAVLERFGVELEPEVVLTGGLGERWRQDVR